MLRQWSGSDLPWPENSKDRSLYQRFRSWRIRKGSNCLNITTFRGLVMKIWNCTLITSIISRDISTLLIMFMMTRHLKNRSTKIQLDCQFVQLQKDTMLRYSRMVKLALATLIQWKGSSIACLMRLGVSFLELLKISSGLQKDVKIKM